MSSRRNNRYAKKAWRPKNKPTTGGSEGKPPPYPLKRDHTPDSEIKSRFDRLSNYSPELNSYFYRIRNIRNIPDNMLMYNGDYLLVDSPPENYDKFDNLSDHFIEDVRVKCKRSDQQLSSFEFWQKNHRSVTAQARKKSIHPREALFEMHYECTNFKPSLMVAFSKIFKSSRVLDISSGWGDRLIGAMASPDVEYYLGSDPNSALQPGYSSMIEFFGKNPTDYRVADSTFQDLDLSKEKPFDLVFTSPPYFDLEEYTTDKKLLSKQSYKEFSSLDSWLNDFLIPCMRKAFGHLKTGGHMIININDAPNRPPYIRDMIHLATQFPGAIYLGCISQHDKSAERKSPQPFWIWQKVDDLPTLENYNPTLVIDDVSGSPVNRLQYDSTANHSRNRLQNDSIPNPIKFNVIRDDELLGGTKQRGAIDLFQQIPESEFVYPGPNNGFAQIALAIGAKLTGKKATLFVAKSRPMTKQTMQAIRLGANVIECGFKAPLKILRAEAEKYIARTGAASAKLGFDDEVFKSALEKNIISATKGTALEDREKKRTFWIVGGSAVLARLMYKIFPNSFFNVVQVGKLIDELLDYDKSKLYVAPQHFYEDAPDLPPYPSVSNYDAKVWQFAKSEGQEGDFIWNVAKDPELHSDFSNISDLMRDTRSGIRANSATRRNAKSKVSPKNVKGGAIKMSKSQAEKLEKEYSRFEFVTQILDLLESFPNSSKTKKNRYEFRNCIERWLLSTANFSSPEDKFDPIFSEDSIRLDSRFNKQLIHELTDKKILTLDLAKKFIRDISQISTDYKSSLDSPPEHKPGQLKIFPDRVSYKKYSRRINSDRIKFLRSMGSDFELGRMVLRYASILPGAQHWNMPVENYKLYHDQGVRIEGFSSPINSQLITIDPENCRFCSLFPDVDSPFGSLGNFFEVDYIGKTVAVGPPYTVELFEKISKKLQQTCEQAEKSGEKVMFYVTFSAWEDTEGFNSIKNSEYCHFAAIMEKFNHFYVNTNDTRLPEITASFATVFFVVSYGHNRKSDSEYLSMLSAMTRDLESPHRVIKSIKEK